MKVNAFFIFADSNVPF